MGVIRGLFLSGVCVLFVIILFIAGMFGVLGSSLKYDNVKEKSSEIIKKNFINENNSLVIKQKNKILNNNCINSTDYTYYDRDLNQTFTIPCDIIKQKNSNIINYQIDLFIKKIYYEKYECKFWKCFKEEKKPFFLISEHAQKYWNSLFKLFLTISLFFAILIFLLLEGKINFPFLIGILILISSFGVYFMAGFGDILFRWILSLAGLALDNLAGLDINLIIGLFFSEYKTIFLKGFVLCMIFVSIGIILKVSKIGLDIGGLFSKEESKKPDDKPKENKPSDKPEKKDKR